jgi:shikimate dehydrogenase
MIQLGLVGYPLGHSLSPNIHRAALKACELEGNYSLFPIRPEHKQGLEDVLGRVRAGEIHGLNITIPHKQNVIPLLDELTPTAQAIGAVNTMYLRENKLIGDNTDAAGFLSDLKRFLATATHQRKELNAVVLGAGGSARAVVYALVNDGWGVTIASRRVEQAQELAAKIEGIKVEEFNLQTLQLSNFQLVVNTTPVGMSPNTDQSALPENMIVPNNILIYDLVYNPRETKLVSDARAKGLSATTGLGMLIEQAALAFELWTGCNPPREKLWEAVETDHRSLMTGD